MLAETHGSIGWLIGLFCPESDRRLRNCCAVAATIPDIDALTYLGGQAIYEHWHRTFGHNAFLGLAVVAVSVHLHRDRSVGRRVLVALAVAVSFASHLLADAAMTQYEVFLWWPLSRKGYNIDNLHEIGDPLHTKIYYAMFGVLLLVAIWKKITPIDIFSPRLDRLIVNAFRARTLACVSCGGRCNNACDGCGKPVCMKHAVIGRSFALACPACSAPPLVQ